MRPEKRKRDDGGKQDDSDRIFQFNIMEDQPEERAEKRPRFDASAPPTEGENMTAAREQWKRDAVLYDNSVAPMSSNQQREDQVTAELFNTPLPVDVRSRSPLSLDDEEEEEELL
jgi:hypothetical protein